ncbi:hypothetical protein SASPL_152871 [Salvia splendens]|uniref:MutL C-terminal dimerisation domain-containing protein n=1 Tax=Salvia splendens TaxID=180675 RepID=A0A8X8W4G5_SALSN|nr:hypothetical protein SASPL_152871 [Salvia splendens]
MRSIERLPETTHSSVRSGVVICDLTRIVEELVFNSLDAGATEVAVSVGVGSSYLKVVDNVDYLALDASTTENLDYHGEALCSISDVSLLEIVTKVRGKSTGYKKILKKRKCVFIGINNDREEVGTTDMLGNPESGKRRCQTQTSLVPVDVCSTHWDKPYENHDNSLALEETIFESGKSFRKVLEFENFEGEADLLPENDYISQACDGSMVGEKGFRGKETINQISPWCVSSPLHVAKTYGRKKDDLSSALGYILPATNENVDSRSIASGASIDCHYFGDNRHIDEEYGISFLRSCSFDKSLMKERRSPSKDARFEFGRDGRAKRRRIDCCDIVEDDIHSVMLESPVRDSVKSSFLGNNLPDSEQFWESTSSCHSFRSGWSPLTRKETEIKFLDNREILGDTKYNRLQQDCSFTNHSPDKEIGESQLDFENLFSFKPFKRFTDAYWSLSPVHCEESPKNFTGAPSDDTSPDEREHGMHNSAGDFSNEQLHVEDMSFKCSDKPDGQFYLSPRGKQVMDCTASKRSVLEIEPESTAVQKKGKKEEEFTNIEPVEWSILQVVLKGNSSSDIKRNQDGILNIFSDSLQLDGASLVPKSVERACLENAKVLEQVDKKFIAIVAGKTLAIIDQHAADERIKLEELRSKVLSGEMKTIKYLDSEHELVLPEIGLKFLYKVPCIFGVVLNDIDLLEFLQQLADTDGSSTIPPSVHLVLNSKACRGNGNSSSDIKRNQDGILNIFSDSLQLDGASLVPKSVERACLENAKVLEQVDKKFIAIVAGKTLAIIDQHAADERIKLEELRSKVLSGEMKTIKYLDSEHELVLPEIGLKFLYKVPCIFGVVLNDIDLLEFLQQLADTDGSSTIPPSVHRVLNSKACRGAIMFGDTLLPSECSLIVDELKQTSLCFQVS